MMLRLLLAFAALAATALATGYLDGKEYVYSYKSQIHTGFPRIKPQFSGYEFHAKVIIQPHGDYAIVKVDDVQNAQFNGEFEDVHKHHHDYKPLADPSSFMSKPFKIIRKNGVVTHFEVTKGEPMFSVNLKRGLAYLFNLNFDAPETTSTEDNDILRSEPEAHYYKVYEEGLLGDCETAYVIGHHPYYRTPHNNIVLNVTKVRNYHKCNTAPNQVYSTFYGHECGTEEHERAHTLHGNAQFNYNIRGHRHNYVIERIVTEGEIAYTPYPIEGQTVETQINRYLTLVAERPVTTPLEVSNDLDTYDSLMYEFSHQKSYKDPVDLKQPHYLYHLTGRRATVDSIKAQVEDLIQIYQDETYQEKFKDKNFPAKFVELLRAAGTIGIEEIQELYKLYGEIPKTGQTPEQSRARNLLVDALVATGTNPSFLFAKHAIENKIASQQEAAHFFGQLPLHIREVSETLFDSMWELCEHSNVKKNPRIYVPCLLSFSTIVYDHCVGRYHPEGIPPPKDKRTCQPEDAIKYFEKIAHLWETTSNEKLKQVYLKAAGNIGLREIIPYIRDCVEHADCSDGLRYNAIWALKKVGFRFPDKVRELLVPVLFNQTENHEMRLHAFNVLLINRPELYELEGVAKALKHDPDDQLRSFVYKTFQHYANSTHPCDRKISKNSVYALRILEDVHHEFDKYDYDYSSLHYVAGYDHDYDFGGSTKFAYIASDTGYVPRAAYLGISDYIGGRAFPTLGFGWRQKGLEKFLDNIIGPEGSLGRRSFFDLFKKRSKRETDAVEKELNEIKSKVNIPVHNYDPINGEFYFNYMGNHLSFFSFDDKTFEDFFKEGRFNIPKLLPTLWKNIPEFYYQRFMLTIDKFYAIPSESGIPVLFDYKQPLYFFHHNKKSSFRVEPGFFAEERGGKYPDHVIIETDGHLAMDKNLFATMSVIMPFDQVTFGAGINRRATLSLPLKLKLDLDVKEKKLQKHWTPVAPHEIYHFKYEPYTFVDSYTNSVPVVQENYLPVKRLSNKEEKRSFFHDATGLGFDVTARYENEFNDKGSWIRFLLEKDYREKFYYMFANPHFEPYDVDVVFSKAAEDATDEVQSTWQYKFFDSEYTTPEFATEGFEDFKAPAERGHMCTCSLEGEMVRTGGKERRVKVGLTWTRDLVRSYHKMNFYYDRTPFWKSETQNLKICGSSYIRYPHYDIGKVATLDTLGMDHTVHSELKLHFGKDCSADQKIKVDGTFFTTDEQRELESQREVPDTPEHYNPYSHLYQDCLKDRARGVMFGQSCMDYIKLVSTVHGYNYHIKHEKLSSRFLYYAYKVGGWMKHAFHDYSEHTYADVDPTQEYAAPGEMHVYSNFSIRLPEGDIRVVKPKTISRYTHAYMPSYHGFRSYPVFEDIHIKNSMAEVNCKLEGDDVITFDRYEYTLPPIECYKIVAKDCSPKEFFTVLGKKITHPKYSKAVKVFLGKHKIEALPVSDDSDVIIRVDGKRVAVTDAEPYLHRESEDQYPDFYITHRDVYYALHSEKYGLIVEYNGHGIIIQASPYYRNKLCGLCGNYNGQKYDGYLDEHGCYFPDDNAHSYAYSIPSDTCSVPKVEKKCPTEEGFGCTKLRTKVVEMGQGKAPVTCFSREPVAECSSHCKATSVTTHKMHFHCLPSKDDSTKALLRQQAHRIIHEVRRKSADHEHDVEVPERCVAA